MNLKFWPFSKPFQIKGLCFYGAISLHHSGRIKLASMIMSNGSFIISVRLKYLSLQVRNCPYNSAVKKMNITQSKQNAITVVTANNQTPTYGWHN